MCIISEFKIQVSKEKVFEIIDCRKDSHIYKEAEMIYDKMLRRGQELAKPIATYIIKRKEEFNSGYYKICEHSHVILCLISLGEDISLHATENFEEGNYLEGLMLDTIADQMVFSLTEQLYLEIYENAKIMNLGLTKRMSPGDRNIPIEMQKEILFDVLANKDIDVGITDGYMLNPVKSLTYFYGADKDMSLARADHDCAECSQENCKFKNKEDVNIDVLSENGKISIKGSVQKSLLENLIENGMYIESPCNGNCTCGKCKIQILDRFIEPTQEEILKLSEEELKNDIRLACCIYAKENIVIKVSDTGCKKYKILSDFESRDKICKPIIEVRTIDSVKGDLKNQKSLTNIIKDKVGSNNLRFSIKSLKKIGTFANRDYLFDNCFSLYGKEKLNLIINKNEVIDVCSVDSTLVFSIAIDIGTTTIAISLIDLICCKPVETHTVLNSQRQYGADVISRIKFSMISDSELLAKCIKDDILKGIKEVCALHRISLSNIYNITIAGNTTMIHLLLDLPAQSIAESPFTTTTTSLLEYAYNEVFDYVGIECNIVALPGISAYVGADIVAGMLNCGFEDLKEITMLIDIGTNGEIVIGDSERIYCAATAAGPAFEGANIQNGIGSVSGAIYSVGIEDGNLSCKTIDEKEPIGICGTGVIDIVYSGLRNGMIDSTGKLNEKYEERYFELYRKENNRICFYQKDVRELQLAKSAIRSGMEVLIKKFGCTYEDIGAVYIAGGFGNNLNLDAAKGIGLIPNELNNKIILAGNSSLGGTVDFILNKNSQNNIDAIINKTKYIELSAEEEFNRIFIENLGFDMT
jgi:uncharacterized 2Fe-2S/4Fe-4S cluster protein (DUF4445 family)